VGELKKGSRRHHSQETRRKISEALKANPHHPFRGKHLPNEMREKIRQSNIGQKRSETTKKNISAGLKRHWQPQEVRDRQLKWLKRL
jgi:hypothetical protein